MFLSYHSKHWQGRRLGSWGANVQRVHLVHSRDLSFGEYLAAVLGPPLLSCRMDWGADYPPIWRSTIFQSSSASCPRKMLTACYQCREESLLQCDACGPLYWAGEFHYEVWNLPPVLRQSFHWSQWEFCQNEICIVRTLAPSWFLLVQQYD